MKVTVTKYLNVRVGEPSVNAPCYQYLAPGSELEVDGKLIKGDAYQGNDVWLKDKADNYYWSGGVENLRNSIHVEMMSKWWLKNFNLPEIWSQGISGKGIKIAVLDTGISYPHPDLSLDENLFENVTESTPGTNDSNGHGTHCIGIIKMGNNEIGSTGIAYNSSIYVCKITDDEFGDRDEYMIKGIEWSISNNVDIISISKGNPFDDNNLQRVITAAASKGILVVAAAGNKIQGYPDKHIYYPARYNTTLSVGGIDENNLPLNDSLLTNETDIYAPGKEILSTYKSNSYLNLSGSSQATPFIAGICALVLEYKRTTKPEMKAIEVKDILINNAFSVNYGRILDLKNIFH
jgi:minor extracellular protease Epr